LRNDDAELLKEYILQLKSFLRKNRFLLVGVTIPYFNDYYIIELKKSGLVKNPFEIPPTVVVQATLIIDLKKSKDELWADINPGRRRNIKKGLKQKFVFREGTRKELKTFHDLLLMMCERRKSTPTHNDVEFFYRLWDNMAPQGWFKLFLLEYESKPVCALVGFTIGDTFRYWKWGWSGEYPELNFSSVLIWKTIDWAKENGFSAFDLMQVDLNVAKAVKDRKELTRSLKERSFAGPTQFKVRFGGEIETTQIYLLFRNKIMKTVFQYIITPLTKKRWFYKLLQVVKRKV
jgi:lipid II:glycine glycyltransferase (peptidoglycan interpeptide bridge formation enzyme)